MTSHANSRALGASEQRRHPAIDPLSRRWLGRAGGHGPVMLMFHAIEPGDGSPAWTWSVSLGRFVAQLDLLVEAGWRTCTMAELATLDPASDDARRTVCITFDDGFENNLPGVEALLQRGMCATWFIVSGAIGRTPDWPADGRPDGPMLGARHLREMQACGMEIGSHTVGHHRLTRLDAAQREAELRDSRAALEDCLGNPVPSFAYPYGDLDDAVATAVARNGYRQACTTRTGWALRDRDRYRMRRLTVFNTDTAASLARKQYFGGQHGDVHTHFVL